MPSFDAPDVQIKTGDQIQARVVGRVKTNCCLMLTFDREISAATDTVRTGGLPNPRPYPYAHPHPHTSPAPSPSS